MPIYEYYCDDCEKPFDVFVRSVNPSVKLVCPDCGGEHVEKQATAARAVGLGTTSTAAACAPSG